MSIEEAISSIWIHAIALPLLKSIKGLIIETPISCCYGSPMMHEARIQ